MRTNTTASTILQPATALAAQVCSINIEGSSDVRLEQDEYQQIPHVPKRITTEQEMRQIRLNEWISLSQCPANTRVSLRLIAALRCESAEQQPFITPPFYHLSRAYGVIFLQTLRIYPILHNHNKYIPFPCYLPSLWLSLCVCMYERAYRVVTGGLWWVKLLILRRKCSAAFWPVTHSLYSAGEEPMLKIIRASL